MRAPVSAPLPPRYTVPGGLDALKQRITSLLDQTATPACQVYVDLTDPGPKSCRHALITCALVDRLSEDQGSTLPQFNTNPPAGFRLMTAAAAGATHYLKSRPEKVPSEHRTARWERLVELSHAPIKHPASAADLYRRLGFMQHAVTSVGLPPGALRDPNRYIDLDVESGPERRSILIRLGAEPDQVAASAVTASGNPALTPRVRLALANGVLVARGKASTRDSAFLAALDNARRAAAEVGISPFDDALARHTFYRAAAFDPYLRQDAAGAIDMLDTAADYLDEAEAALAACPQEDVRVLALGDYRFPLLETLSKTLLFAGHLERAGTTSEQLTRHDPADPRSWLTRGLVQIAQGNLSGALRAYERASALGGHWAAAAHFYSAWVLQRQGLPQQARQACQRSLGVDATSQTALRLQAELAG